MIDILPHEIHFLENLRSVVAEKQVELAAEKKEAQGESYDWHDNAPLDAIEEQLKFYHKQMEAAEGLVKSSEVVCYPDHEDIRVRLGSLVVAKVKSEDMPFVLVGQSAAGAEKYPSAWAIDGLEEYRQEDLYVVTPSSPLGAAALNATLGQNVKYKVGERAFEAVIEHIDQDWVRSNFSELEQATAATIK